MTIKICKKRQSILDSKSHCLVLGGPGSGKTTLALLKAINRIDQHLSPGQNVLFLSFSRAAVARIADAAKKDVPQAKIAALSIQTFHSFFWFILQGHGYLLGAPRFLSIVPAHEEKALRDGIERDNPLWVDWEKKREKMFYSEGRVCFDLFAPLASELLSRTKRVCKLLSRRFPLILVDEAQDTGNEQWECIHLLSKDSQIICLADPDQMIFDYLPGVGPGRIAEIRKILKPLEIDLEDENNRSAGTDILKFARDVFAGQANQVSYKGVSRKLFNPTVTSRDKAIRQSIGILIKRIEDETGEKPKSIALISSYTNGVAIISAALQKQTPIQHNVFFDEAFALLSSRTAAFLLEPKKIENHAHDVATVLDMVSLAFRTKGTKTARAFSIKSAMYSLKCRDGKAPKVSIVKAADSIVTAARNTTWSGNPRKDWITAKHLFKQAKDKTLVGMGFSLDYLVSFGKGDRIAESLSSLWMQYGSYVDCRRVFDIALTQEQLFSDRTTITGIHVMNMHKCKGKQFDGVVLYRQQYHSPFIWQRDASPYPISRRILHMAISRAKQHVLILEEAYPNCPIMSAYEL